MQTHKIVLVLLLCLTLIAPAHADPEDYPTVTALEETTIPIRDRVDLARRLLGVTDIPAPPTTPPVYAIGDTTTFTATNTTDRHRFTVEATLRALGDHLALWVENGTDMRDSDLAALVDAFDNRVYPNVRGLWGSENIPGVDGDPRVHGLFARGLGNTTAAYFASDHTYPREVYPNSNVREMFFFNIDTLPAPFSLPVVESIVAHEFQHMIRHNIQLNEDTWINEGMSSFTQVYLYGNVDSAPMAFLATPDTQLTDWNTVPGRRAANYGAAVLFLVYVYERFGLDAIHDLSADPSPRAWESVDHVVRAYGAESADSVFADWVMVNLLHSMRLSGTARFNGSEVAHPYKYDELPSLITPPPTGEFRDLPISHKGSVAPYATNYFLLPDVNDMAELNITLNASADTTLIPAIINGQAMYSNRADLSDTRLTQTFDLSGVETATLDYRVWYDFEPDWDFGYLMASRDGMSWEALASEHTTTTDPNAVAYGAGYTGESDGWVDESVSLDAYVGGQVTLRYEAITDDAVNRAGMAIDDVRIDAIGYAADFETDSGGWLTEGWLVTDNRLPATFIVQAAILSESGVNVIRWESQGNGAWTLPLPDDARQVWIAVSPVVPVTTVPLSYELLIEG